MVEGEEGGRKRFMPFLNGLFHILFPFPFHHRRHRHHQHQQRHYIFTLPYSEQSDVDGTVNTNL